MKESDFKIECTKGSGPGGQHKNKTNSCVKVTHIPTGLTETCQETRTQRRNIKLAKERLVTRLLDIKIEEDKVKQNKFRRDQINSGARSFRRRTYDYKSGMVTDHISGKKAPLSKVMNGELDLLR